MRDNLTIEPELLDIIDSLPNLDINDVAAGRCNEQKAFESALEAGVISSIPGRTEIDKELNVVEQLIPGPAGEPDIPVRIYHPKCPSGPRPGFVLFHGGAWVFGGLNSEHIRCLKLAKEAGAVVVNVDYRLAPENPFPAGVEDCYAALQWTANNSEALGIDKNRIAVGGASAGGNLSAAVALMARDRSGPAIAYQMLMYPVIDNLMDSPSMRHGEGLPVWDKALMQGAWKYYLGTDAFTEHTSPYAAPARANDLGNLPPAYILTAEHDPLRDEAIIYAMRLLQAGVSTELHQVPATVHGFDLFGCGGVSDRALDLQVSAFNRQMAL
ncbi:alpha/beta hydrolase [Pseudomaricurvus alkylphenolicus]|uniref:alpha/beta hydrolase n=1 Tax=Pseudomaricurvus alkylphenolicus TaxID=1306991 RepID=UPI0014210E58|nr:alpha/beta hydrolase [Pseudomaricurvus alkylphenolicus]NIB38999.1 alpha/beta hydrolase [Pseudomaricurvus alkylphenolicus]